MRKVMMSVKRFVFPTKARVNDMKHKQKWVLWGFYGLVFVIMLNVLSMSYFRYVDDFRVLPFTYEQAVTQAQPVSGTMDVTVVRLSKLNTEAITVGDRVVAYEQQTLLPLNRAVPIVLNVIEVDESLSVLELTYDDVLISTIALDDVLGVYETEASIVGVFYFLIKQPGGYVFMMLSHVLVLLLYYYVFIYDHPRRFINH